MIRQLKLQTPGYHELHDLRRLRRKRLKAVLGGEDQTFLSNRGSRRWHLFPPKKPVWRDGRCAGGEC